MMEGAVCSAAKCFVGLLSILLVTRLGAFRGIKAVVWQQ